MDFQKLSSTLDLFDERFILHLFMRGLGHVDLILKKLHRSVPTEKTIYQAMDQLHLLAVINAKLGQVSFQRERNALEKTEKKEKKEKTLAASIATLQKQRQKIMDGSIFGCHKDFDYVTGVAPSDMDLLCLFSAMSEDAQQNANSCSIRLRPIGRGVGHITHSLNFEWCDAAEPIVMVSIGQLFVGFVPESGNFHECCLPKACQLYNTHKESLQHLTTVPDFLHVTELEEIGACVQWKTIKGGFSMRNKKKTVRKAREKKMEPEEEEEEGDECEGDECEGDEWEGDECEGDEEMEYESGEEMESGEESGKENYDSPKRKSVASDGTATKRLCHSE